MALKELRLQMSTVWSGVHCKYTMEIT